MKSGLAAAFLCALASLNAQSWKLQFFHDDNDSRFTISDFAFPSAKRGIAAGYLTYPTANKKPKPYAVVTADGGRTWTGVDLPALPISLFFVDDTRGWLVTESALWKTEESGRSWKKVRGIEGVLRVHFLDEKHGFALGVPKRFDETFDGGLTWKPVPAGAGPSTKPENTHYFGMTFLGKSRGIALGVSSPPRPGRRNELPDWADPEAASKRRQWPSMMITIETFDGGGTWKPQTVPAFGIPTRIRLSPNGKRGLVLIRFTQSFEFPSELYWLGAKQENPRAFRETDRMVTDMGFLDDRTAVLAAIEPPAKLHTLPIPGKLRILFGVDSLGWAETKVDYRAVGREAMLRIVGEHEAWVALDTGMILKLEP